MSFVCACLVVFIHVGFNPARGTWMWWASQMMTHVGITRIAVPFFFLAAGFFLAGRMTGNIHWYWPLVRKRVTSLLVPYFLWNFIYLCFALVLSYAAAKVGAEIHIQLPNCRSLSNVVAAFGLNPIASPGLQHLWFVRNLFYLVLLSPVWWLTLKCGRPMLVLVLAYLLVAVIMGSASPDGYTYSFLRYNISLEGLFFFLSGIALRVHPIVSNVSRRYGALVLMVGFAIFVCRAVVVRLGLAHAVENTIAWIGIPVLMFGVWSVMPSRGLLGRVTSCSFPIYCMHYFFAVALAGILGVCGLREWANHESLCFYIVRGGLLIILSCATVALLRRSLPRLTALLFGGR